MNEREAAAMLKTEVEEARDAIVKSYSENSDFTENGQNYDSKEAVKMSDETKEKIKNYSLIYSATDETSQVAKVLGRPEAITKNLAGIILKISDNLDIPLELYLLELAKEVNKAKMLSELEKMANSDDVSEEDKIGGWLAAMLARSFSDHEAGDFCDDCAKKDTCDILKKSKEEGK